MNNDITLIDIMDKTPGELYKELGVESDKNLILIDENEYQYSYHPNKFPLFGPFKYSKITDHGEGVPKSFMLYTTYHAFLEDILMVFKDGEYVKPGTLNEEHWSDYFPDSRTKRLPIAISEYNEGKVLNIVK